MINALASRIWRYDAFHAAYRSLLREHLATSLGVGDASDGLSDDAIWRLLQSATHLSGVTEIPEASAMRAAAYSIAVSAWRLYRQRFDNLGKILHFVLGRLGNFPAIDYLSHTDDEDRSITLPDPLWLEVAAHAIENRVEVTQTESITLTDFQRRLWMALEAGTPTAVTAPTSAGKSFVLQHFLVAAVLGAPGQWGLYVVPTRALITQVSSELMRLFKDLAPERDVQVLTIPLPPETLGVSNGVYVLTQERTQILIESGIELPFRLAIIDEAHNLGEGARGIVLQTVIEKLQRNEQGVRFLFGCPQTGNLQVFQRVFAFDQLEPITERDSPVAQNLIFLNINSKDPAQVSVGAIIDGETTDIGTLNIGISVVGKPEQRLATVSWAVGKHDQNLVYVGGPAKCEVVSDLLRQFAVSEGNGSVNVDVHQRREEFAAFLREHIHPQYLLADTVLAGVGFHYGNMPSTVRKTLEEYFAAGDLSYLACTTTLLAGVNLPAKNLFLLDPTKGSEFENRKEQAISATDFWNLAGRAGRLGKDFEGNVFLIDHARWRADPLAGPREQELASAVEETVVTRGNDFLQFVRDHEHPSGREPAFENTFVKLVNHARRGELTDQLSRVFRDTKPSLRAEIHTVIEEAAERAEIPQEVAERNINVSIYRQDEMLRHLVEKIQHEGPESVIPIHPLIGAAYNNLLGVFGRIAVYFEHNSARSYIYFTRLALQWMRGSSLARLIADAYSYDASHRSRGSPNVSTVIRRVMREIERDLRFRYVKYTNCNNDLLREALGRTGYEHEATSSPMLPLYLELGASSATMVSLIGLGLTRTTAGVVADRAFRSGMDRAEAERWLRQQPWESMGISPICVREIWQLLG